MIWSGLPEVPGEVLVNKFMEIISNIGKDLVTEDIESIYRIGVPRKSSSKPRLLCIKFARKDVSDKVYLARVKLRNYESLTLFFNEDLTTGKDNLFYKARQLSKQKKWHSCWTSNGCIFAKKTKNDQMVRIVNEIDMVTKIV